MRRLLLFCLLLTIACTNPRLAQVEEVQLVTTDLDNFWAAYPAAMRDTAQAYRVFEQQYFAKGSPAYCITTSVGSRKTRCSLPAASRNGRRNTARPTYANTAVKEALAQKPGVLVKMLPGNVGYIQLPGINAGGSLQAMRDAAKVVQDSLCRINPDKAKAWIVDLRLNDGGAMAPMLAGIAQLLGDGHLGGFVDKDGKPDQQWYLRQGNFYMDTMRVTTLQNRCPARRTDKPIAVLLSGRTASSGEIVAISLKGRPNTRFFGEPTYGATTANESYRISGTSYLTIAGLQDADRNQVAYKSHLTPDVLITGGDNFTDLNKDTKVAAALKWLKKPKGR